MGETSLSLADCKQYWPDFAMDTLVGSALGGARFQGKRATCLAFSASAAHSVALARADDLCVEWLYCCAKLRDGTHGEGLQMRAVREALREDGQPEEFIWPYNESRTHDDPTYCLPATDGAQLFRRQSVAIGQNAIGIVSALTSGRPVILGLETTVAFFEATGNSGRIELPKDAQATIGLHSVLAVGWGRDSASSICLVVRNSWGAEWGVQGYALLTAAYAELHVLDAVCVV